jgi:peroxiredoxin
MRFFLLACTFSLTASAVWADPNLSNRRAPGFSVMDNTMQYRDLADFRGRLVLLDLIQTGCPHCQTLAKAIVKAKQKYGDKIAVLSVVLPPDTPATVAKFIKDYGVSTPVLFDCGQLAASYVKADPQKPSLSFPHLFMIDAQGNIKSHFGPGAESEGVSEFSALAKEIDRLLAPAPATKK